MIQYVSGVSGMRVIAGKVKGRKLHMVKNDRTRPTADRVKESLFNILGDSVMGARVLDIFAGVGSLGIEALSRGAKTAVFIDNDSRCTAVITRNLTELGLAEYGTVIKADFRKALKRLTGPFDLVFADPPYDTNYLKSTAELLCRNRLLAPAGLFVAEHRRDAEIELRELKLLRRKDYGQTTLSFFVCKEELE